MYMLEIYSVPQELGKSSDVIQSFIQCYYLDYYDGTLDKVVLQDTEEMEMQEIEVKLDMSKLDKFKASSDIISQLSNLKRLRRKTRSSGGINVNRDGIYITAPAVRALFNVGVDIPISSRVNVYYNDDLVVLSLVDNGDYGFYTNKG